ncbi:MAG: hypothetical protein RLZZ299_2340 [Pseudomonadota bacterium]|jgi:hypothetical protein
MAPGAAVLLAVACAVTRAGMVRAERPGDAVWLVPYEAGAPLRLQLPAEAAPLAGADGVVVEVRGRRTLGGLRVADWRVLDAGDGSGGFVGRLRPWGTRLAIDDRNSGAMLIIDDATSASLRPWEGRVVLLQGHVVGGRTVEVVAVRVLDDADAGAEGARPLRNASPAAR